MLNDSQLKTGTIVYHPTLQYCHVVNNYGNELLVRYQDAKAMCLRFKVKKLKTSELYPC